MQGVNFQLPSEGQFSAAVDSRRQRRDHLGAVADCGVVLALPQVWTWNHRYVCNGFLASTA